MVGVDYRGELVLAAHEPVSELNLGIVSKIDLSEIRAPFVKAAAIGGFLSVLVVLGGAALFLKISNPMVKLLEVRNTELADANQKLRQEIVERTRVEEALRKSETKYRNIYSNIQDVYYETSPDGIILEVSPSIENFSQYRQEELIGKSIYDIFSDPEETGKLIEEILAKQKAIIASGFSETKRAKEAQKLGAGQYVKKPYTLEKLGLSVKKELEK